MRIVHLILTSHFAGSERHAIELANAQAAEGHEVMMVLRRSSAKSRPGAYAWRVDPRVKKVLVGDWFARWQARQLVRQWRPDVAHAHLSAACKALHGLKGLCLRVATLHIRYKPQQHADLDALIAIAPWQLADIGQSLRGHTTQIDNWTLSCSPAVDARQRLRRQHGIPLDAWVFGTIGRAEHSKGFDLLIEAFQRARLFNAHLVIVGHGDALDVLRRSAGPNVHLPGFTDAPEDWLAAFDGFVSAARDEPFGLVLLEAMESGLPILASVTQGARHLSEVIGEPLFPLEDVHALTNRLREWAVRRPHRRPYPMERFRIEDKLPQIQAFYESEMERIAPSTTGAD